MSSDPLLLALLDSVIPAGNGMPSAGTEALADEVLTDARTTPLGRGLDAVLSALPADFDSLDAAGREDALRSVVAQDAASVDAVVNLVYTSYYTDPDVLARLEASTGYHAGPPQPRGYRLEPFDPTLVTRVRANGHVWREC